MNRRRSAASQENDTRLLDAALDEIVEVGVDGLGMSGVARRAGLTTGALYGRYENVNELAAGVWTSCVRDEHFAFLDAALRTLVGSDGAIPVSAIVRELASPGRTTVAALELLATARRIDELDEVVAPDVERWLRGWGATVRARDSRRRAQVLFTLGSLWGVLLHALPRARRTDWPTVFERLGRSYLQPYDEPDTRLEPERTDAVRAETGDDSESALIDSVSIIVARVGFERATTSRIARRAGFTSGAIYARYKTKDELLAHAVDVLLAKRFADDLVTNRDTYFKEPDVGAATARIFGGYLAPARREWRLFRIEAQLASRHRPQLAATLDRVQERAIRDYLDALGARTAGERRVLDGLARFAQLIPLGLAFVDLVAPASAGTDWRYVLVPLLAPGPF
jgi:TetR/AcrR family transcriptional repressor of uid operon